MDGDDGQIEEAMWMSVKGGEYGWHRESFVQQGQ